MADIELVKKSDLVSYYVKTEVDAKVADKVTTATLTTELGKKANTGVSYTKAESDTKYALTTALDGKANTDTVYTKVESDGKYALATALAGKANTGVSYTKAESDGKYALTTALAGKADVSAIPTKTSQLTNDSKFLAEGASGSKIAFVGEQYTGLSATDIQAAIIELKGLMDILNTGGTYPIP